MHGFFLVLFLTMQPNTAPQIIHPFDSERDCRTASVKANQQPDMKSAEAVAAGALFACVQLIAD